MSTYFVGVARCVWIVIACVLLAAMPGPARAYDDCGIAEPAALGDELLVDLSAATADGASTCDGPDRPDLWFRWLAPNAEAVYVLGADRDDIAARDAHFRRIGVTGVPCFIIAGQHAVPGCQPADLWLKVIDELQGRSAAAGDG